ncbi:DNA-binding LacI/PurR family transcriptional regulator [Okibacterium sp. HSC-33S16]|uniref:LacI family DNA-binding transcriptional regulator n=1 Tax=Okibacterium sp. HSC-33S16 TaxID=2910965 RepID=UPI00209D3EC0|nr:LacI family DNA-binding transcriptional regulator [Okibacterium sp. HSC-33S16]MCP2032113.1 DNA-binding LacI/PurR family transcriptional regulator [Okibacterium sp. HSC-33S16]
MTITMRDVARASGVSLMTVSNVINGRPGAVGTETRLRVLEAVERLGYEVNLTARRLRNGLTGTVGLIVPRFDHPYFGELAARLATELAKTGRHLSVEQSGASAEGELAALSHARIATYDAVLLSVVGLHYDDVDKLQTSVPIVLLGEQGMPRRFDHVQLDNEAGAHLATGHLIERGARHLLIVGGGDEGRQSMTAARTRGWERAQSDAGLTPRPDGVLELAELEVACARIAVRERLAQTPEIDGIFAVTDQVAFGVMAGVHDAGLRVPEDVQIVGFDNLALGEHMTPGLTTIDPSHDWMVQRAAALIDQRIAGQDVPPQHLISPSMLVARGTTRE